MVTFNSACRLIYLGFDGKMFFFFFYILFIIFLLFRSPSLHYCFPYYNPCMMTNMSHPSHSIGHHYYFLNRSLSSLSITLYFISQHLTLITSVAQSRPHVKGNLVVDRFENHILLSWRVREKKGCSRGLRMILPFPHLLCSHTCSDIDTVSMTTPANAVLPVASAQQKALLFLAAVRCCELSWACGLH